MAGNKKQEAKNKKQKIKQDYLFLVLFSLLILISAFNLAMFFNMNNKIKAEQIKQKEILRPSNLKIIKIIDSSCKSCFEVNEITDELKQKNVEIESEKSIEFNSEEGRNLISKYDIRKIPALIITGETDKSIDLKDYWNEIGIYVGDDNNTILFTKVEPPYFDLTKRKVVGLVSVISIIDSDCKECSSLNDILSAFKASNVEISSVKSIEFNSEEGKELIDRYNIQKIPAIIVSSEIKVYENIASILPKLNATERDGNYALHTNSAPYLDLKTGKIMGLTTLILLDDASCDQCYNVTLHKSIIPNFGVIVTKELFYDISFPDGKKTINKYNITKIPTIILSSDAKEYPRFNQVWDSVGTIETDGWFVFRRVEVMGKFKDLTSNKIIEPSQEEQ